MKAKIPLGPRLIWQFRVLGGLVSRQSAQLDDANTVHVAVYCFCGKSHLCIVLWRMSKDKLRTGIGRGSAGKRACGDI